MSERVSFPSPASLARWRARPELRKIIVQQGGLSVSRELALMPHAEWRVVISAKLSRALERDWTRGVVISLRREDDSAPLFLIRRCYTHSSEGRLVQRHRREILQIPSIFDVRALSSLSVGRCLRVISIVSIACLWRFDTLAFR